MPTKNPRLNVVLEQNAHQAIERLAKKRKISLSLVARDLICEALEIHEDAYWASEASKREAKAASAKWATHKQAWA